MHMHTRKLLLTSINIPEGLDVSHFNKEGKMRRDKEINPPNIFPFFHLPYLLLYSIANDPYYY